MGYIHDAKIQKIIRANQYAQKVWKGLVNEKWEGGIHKIHKGITLGDGIVFSAAKLSNGMVVLLDVYQVRGFPNVQWKWEIVLLNFLQNLSLPEGYETQKYCHRVEDLLMTRCSVHRWFFWLPDEEKPELYRRSKALEKELQNGHVYEVSVKNGNVLRKRNHQFIGNTWMKIENILQKQSWQGPTIHEVVKVRKKTKKSDEAHFWLNGYVNKQNCRIWSEANPQVYVETPLHPEKLTVWCALWAGGILLQKR
ncbi:uncharacterized protein TNCV_4244181 [Trichonephila clavipes]|nr:uncharacterized protein TNCV_4244181 [Trichonephila clavipes]